MENVLDDEPPETMISLSDYEITIPTISKFNGPT